MTDRPLDTPVVLDDRLCERCGFNLHGERIEREPRYSLLVARCPECAQVAAFEAYPRLGPWAARISMLLAALWMMVLIAIGLGGIIFVTATTTAGLIEVTEHLSREIRTDFQEWFARTYPDKPARDIWSGEHYFTEFWAENGQAMLDDPDWKDNTIEWDEVSILLVPSIGAFVFGIFWSLALLAGRRWPLVLMTLGLAVFYIAATGITLVWTRSVTPSDHEFVSWSYQRLPILLWLLPVMVGIFVGGLFAGRPIVRGLVRALMPPRFRGAVSMLWTTSGKPVPWRGSAPPENGR